MKSVLLLRLLLALAITFGFSALPLSAQEEEKPEEQTENDQPERGQRGQRGQGGGQRGQGGGQRGGMPDTSNMTKEERLKAINEMIQKNVVEMANAVEIRDDQQQAFVKAQAAYEVEMLKVRGQMQQARGDRRKMQAVRQSMQKTGNDLEKTMKGILDKDQFKAFQPKMKERQPQGGRGGGGRGR